MTKQYAVVFTPRAERQFENLYAYIAEQSSEARADRFIGHIIDSCTSLSTFPERGTKRADIRPNLRTFGYAHRITIAFSVDLTAAIVAVHGVFYGGQDFESLLRESDD